jgi:hypothetical protein
LKTAALSPEDSNRAPVNQPLKVRIRVETGRRVPKFGDSFLLEDVLFTAEEAGDFDFKDLEKSC